MMMMTVMIMMMMSLHLQRHLYNALQPSYIYHHVLIGLQINTNIITVTITITTNIKMIVPIKIIIPITICAVIKRR